MNQEVVIKETANIDSDLKRGRIACGSRSDLQAFADSIAHGIEGVVDFTDAGRALYTSDASNYRQIPLGVVYPASIDDIRHIVTEARKVGCAVLMRGGGTSQNGQGVNQAVVLDCSRFLNAVKSIDPAQLTADIEPGVVCDQLKAEAEKHGLTFGPDPATHSRCTLGGMIGNNSCGPHSMLAGKTVENVVELDILTIDGEQFTVGPTSDEALAELLKRNDRQGQIYRDLKALADEYGDLIREKFPTIKRRVSGFNLDQLLPENGFNVARSLVGTEGTCVSILGARVNLITNPVCRRLLVLGFEDIFQAGDTVPDILPFKPIAMEGLDWAIVGGLIDRNLRLEEVALLPEGKAWIMMELAAADERSLLELVAEFSDAMASTPQVLACKIIEDSNQVSQIWSIREQGASATAMSLDPAKPDPVVGWEDTAVDPLQLGDYLREFYQLVERYGYTTSMYGHFGDGCIHARMTFDTRSEEGIAKWREFSREIAKTVVRFGGSLSGEHGDGQAKAEFLPIMFGDELVGAFERFKNIWDPQGLMNPGKVVKPYRMDENLRFGPDYKTPEIATTLQFVDDVGGFGRSLERCVGMGKCRADTGSMCPTYQASREERYSTRGRAHLLHEMMRGGVLEQGWQDSDVEDSLANCLSCKACKSSCPTRVDIASYKSEFMARHYASRKRPLAHSVFGKLGDHLPLMAKFPRVVNLVAALPVVGSLIRSALGIDSKKSLPRLATRSFKTHLLGLQDELPFYSGQHFRWFGQQDATKVILWADSFNSHYRPEVLESALRVLVRQGLSVGVAHKHFCCGRPLYEYGLLQEAGTRLQKILDNFYTNLPANTDVIVLEPACLSVFRDELLALKGEDPRAQDLAVRTITLADCLKKRGVKPKRKLGAALLHLHCHQKALFDSSADRELIAQCFESVQEPEPGCCGMAGVFGVQARTRELSGKIFERNLRSATDIMMATATNKPATIVTSGFSCHEQFGDLSKQDSVHIAQVLDHCLPGYELPG